MTKTVQYRCVIGEWLSRPNKITYLQAISSRQLGTWIGHCAGDKSHPEHIFMIKAQERWHVKNSKSDIFTTRWEEINKKIQMRLFDRYNAEKPEKVLYPKLRCPEGKCDMNFQRKATTLLNMDNTDIYKCLGNFQGSGHKEHFVRIQHGALGVKINKKDLGVLIVIIESE